MPKLRALICFAAGLLLTGCEVRSLRPLVTEEDAVFEPALLGTWMAKDDDQRLTMKFKKSGEKSYDMVLETEKGAAHFDARLARLESFLFLDLSPRMEEGEGDSSYVYYSHLIPTHSFARINVEKNTLSLSSLRHDTIKNLISQGQLDIGHEVLDSDVILLTAGTPDLQRFLLQHAEDADVFSSADMLYRQE